MKIEYLFPEFGNLYGDNGNILFLKKSLPNAEIIETNFYNEPRFITEKIDLVYMGAMSERNNILVINKFKKYKDKILELIEKGQHFLCTGNSLAIFGKYIQYNDKKNEALNIFRFYTKGNLDIPRHNYMFLGSFNKIKIIGHKSQFLLTYNNEMKEFMNVEKGIGDNLESKKDGIHYKNFYGTFLLGPLLVLNPYFTKHLLKELGITKTLAFESDVIEAYQYRLKQTMQDNAYINIGEHGC